MEIDGSGGYCSVFSAGTRVKRAFFSIWISRPGGTPDFRGGTGSTERFLNEGCEEERPELVRYQKMLVWGGIFERISFMGKKIGANGFLWGESASAASSSHRNMKGWLPRLKSIREIIKRCYE